MPGNDLLYLDQLAEALLEELGSHEAQDRALDELATIAETFDQDLSFRDTLLNQALQARERKMFLRKALDGRVQTKTLNVLLALLHAHRLGDLSLFIQRMRTVRVQHHAVRDVFVRSAVPITKEERQRITDVLQKQWNTAICLRERVDMAVIGGLVIESDDWYFDATIAGRLSRLTHHLMPRSPYV